MDVLQPLTPPVVTAPMLTMGRPLKMGGNAWQYLTDSVAGAAELGADTAGHYAAKGTPPGRGRGHGRLLRRQGAAAGRVPGPRARWARAGPGVGEARRRGISRDAAPDAGPAGRPSHRPAPGPAPLHPP